MINEQRTHHHGLARTSRHFEGDTRKAGGLNLRFLEVAQNALPNVRFLGNFIEINRSLNCLLLREEK